MIIYFIFLTIVIHKYVTVPTENILIIDGKYKVRDFDYYMIIIKSYFDGDINTIYDKKSQIIALNNFFGLETDVAMPLGISPTALFIWLPFALIFELNRSLSYTVWVSFSILAFTIALTKSFRYALYKNKMMIPWLLIRLLLFIFSITMIACVILGQTTLMACAFLMFLIIEIFKAKDEKRFLRPWVVYPIVFFLSIKLPYIILGIGMLIVFGYMFESFISILVIAATFVLIGIWRGIPLYQDWFQQLAVFSSSIFPDHYPIESILDTIINFRSAFSIFFGSDITIAVSKSFIIIGVILIFFISFVRSMYPLSLQKITSKTTPQQITVLLFAIFLLFMPYFGAYEDLLMIVLYIISALSIARHKSSTIYNVFIAICLCFVLNYRLFPHQKLVLIFWGMKFAVFGSLFINLKGEKYLRI